MSCEEEGRESREGGNTAGETTPNQTSEHLNVGGGAGERREGTSLEREGGGIGVQVKVADVISKGKLLFNLSIIFFAFQKVIFGTLLILVDICKLEIVLLIINCHVAVLLSHCYVTVSPSHTFVLALVSFTLVL